MKQSFLKLFVIATLILSLPLTGMGMVRLNCPCSENNGQTQASATLQKTAPYQGCCEKDSNPRSSRPCQCGNSTCDFILETKNFDQIPLLTDSVASFVPTDLRGSRASLVNSSNEPAPFTPFTFIQEFLYLHIQTLRC